MKKEGKEEELERMFAEALANESGMIEMMGVSKDEYLKALQKK